ncbi:unnamed protein product [Trifolium pratense]|uniref:Uncharacterized protein n=1 Tax=Trifolium pratense TaxID=57577 RepID=A0ACB0L7I5_TRIPR|nr:unnamed protein product [Trifolium pratense]
MEEVDQDRLSSLPKIILHCILSKLPEKDAATTSVLSKAWLDTWYTFPNLCFSTSRFIKMSPVQGMEDSEKMRKMMLGFCDYVKRTILRFHDQSLVIKEFKLQVDYFGLDYISKEDVAIWIKLACECGVESLILYNCKMIERIDISSVRLKVLMLSNCYNLKEVNIDAPNLFFFGQGNLLTCRYKGASVSEPTISFLRNSSRLRVIIRINVDYRDLCNLGKFMQNIKPNNVLTSLYLSISISSNMGGALDPVALYISSPPPSIKQLNILNVPTNKYLFPSVVNILHSSCCPTTITLRVINPADKEFIEFFYEMLMRIKEDKCCCRFYDTKCCWQHLKGVKFARRSMKMDKNVDFKTILKSLTTYESIIFWLEF